MYTVVSGTLASYRERPDGTRRVMGFLFAEDLFGLSHRGVYVNNIKTITPAAVFKFPMDTLTALLTRDAGLQFRFLCKATQVVRETQRQSIMITRRDPVERVAMFLSLLEDAQGEKRSAQDPIELPMTRQDIADYVNLPVGSISPALSALEQRGSHQTERRRRRRRRGPPALRVARQRLIRSHPLPGGDGCRRAGASFVVVFS